MVKIFDNILFISKKHIRKRAFLKHKHRGEKMTTNNENTGKQKFETVDEGIITAAGQFFATNPAEEDGEIDLDHHRFESVDPHQAIKLAEEADANGQMVFA